MKVILTKDHPKLGKEGTIVEVATGHARNYLLPRELALPSTKHNIRVSEIARAKKEKAAHRLEEAQAELGKKLAEISCTITVAAGDEDQLFGSVTAAEVSESIAREGIEIDKKKIRMEEPIKKLGIYSIEVRVAPEVVVPVKVWVVKE